MVLMAEAGRLTVHLSRNAATGAINDGQCQAAVRETILHFWLLASHTKTLLSRETSQLIRNTVDNPLSNQEPGNSDLEVDSLCYFSLVFNPSETYCCNLGGDFLFKGISQLWLAPIHLMILKIFSLLRSTFLKWCLNSEIKCYWIFVHFWKLIYFHFSFEYERK